jgi:hypothetical protein
VKGGEDMQQQPYISSMVTRIKKRLSGGDQATQFKEDVKTAVNIGVDQFIQQLRLGTVQVNTVADFEKLVKLGLLVHGEPTERTEVTTDLEEVREDHMEIVKGSPEFEAIKNMLAAQMNKRNEEA